MDNRDAPLTIGPRRRRRLAAKYRRRRTFVAVAAILVIAAPLTIAIVVHDLGANISSSALRAHDGADVPEKLTDETNVLIIGSDTRDLASAQDDSGPASASGYGSAEGARSDAMILAHIAADGSRIDAVQIPRDTIMDIPACDDTGRGATQAVHGMINSALNGGPACSVSAAETLTGVRVDHFINVDFDGFAAIVDALDGITVDLDEPLKDPKANLDLPAGEQTIGGTDALALARTRHAVGDGSDISRMGNQQMVMNAIIDRAKSSHVLTRPDRLYSFLDAVTSSLEVDDDLDSVSSLASLATTAAAVPKDDITFGIMPWTPAPEDPNRVVKSSQADEVFAAINADEPITDLVN
ncbi:LCP family protein [Brevibacterium oceani]|uniref:LCP family protein n=1 Tax=Brevibacterium oceani TaxID=358099 RepID=UPI001FEB01FB|nr:LCP family protein [Brevibacterium oceani]